MADVHDHDDNDNDTENDNSDDQDATPILPTDDAEPTPTDDSKGMPKRLRNTRVAQDDVPASAPARAVPGRLDRARAHAFKIARIAEENRAKDILVLDLREATPLVDFFVILTATSRRQAAAIASDVDAQMKRDGEFKLGIEGSEEGRWILIDYGDFVVHVFSEDARGYYSLEDIWGDAPQLDWREPGRESTNG